MYFTLILTGGTVGFSFTAVCIVIDFADVESADASGPERRLFILKMMEYLWFGELSLLLLSLLPFVTLSH